MSLRSGKLFQLIMLLFFLAQCETLAQRQADPNLWLEDINGSKAMEWVKKQNQLTSSELGSNKTFKGDLSKALKILESDETIPNVSIFGDYFYTLVQNKDFTQGKWVRNRVDGPFKPFNKWEIVLNLDLLSKKEGKKWVLKEAKCLPPQGRLCLLMMSDGGSDKGVIREFDTQKKQFPKKGFSIPEAKSWAAWVDQNHIALAMDYGDKRQTNAGYGQDLKVLNRSQTLNPKLPTLVDVPVDYLTVIPYSLPSKQGLKTVAIRFKSQMLNNLYIVSEKESSYLNLPNATIVHGFFKNHIVISLRENWKVANTSYKSGDLLAVDFLKLKENKGLNSEDVKSIYSPNQFSSIQKVNVTKDFVVVNTLDKVIGRIIKAKLDNNKIQIDNNLTSKIAGHTKLIDHHYSKNFIIAKVEYYDTPPKLIKINLTTNKISKLFQQKSLFQSTGLSITQNWIQRPDGVKVPYFLVGKKSALKSKKSPVLLRGYGGFEYSRLPTYSPVLGKLWLEKGGVFALANIRGGGEFGPEWHLSAIKENRHIAFDDFIAVAEDIIQRGFTQKGKLGIIGGSNGGLLMGAVMTKRPDLFGAVVSYVPLLDMLRYSKLLAGAAWISEYGDPDIPKERAYLETYSPYHNLKKNVNYPPTFLFTSTKDDRVHPGHARKFAYRLKKLGNERTFYYENTEGGHAGASTPQSKAYWQTLAYQFLWNSLTESD